MAFTTTVTAAVVAGRLKKPADDPDVVRVFNVAVELLTDAAAVTFRTIPANVRDELVLRVARSAYDGLRQANGGAQPTQVDGQTIARVARDALKDAEPLLSRYVVLGLA